MATIKSKGKIMATRKTKRYDDGGDVLGRLMGAAQEMQSARMPDMRDDSMMDRIPRDSIGPRDTSYMDEPPMKRGTNDELAGQITKVMAGSARGAGDGIPLGQREAMGTSDEGIPAVGVSNAKTALQDMTIKKAARDAMVEDMISGMSKQPKVAKIKSSYGGMGGFAKGGSVSKASSRADGIAQRGKTRGKMC